MTNANKLPPLKSFARLAGFMYFLLIPLGILGIMYIPMLVVDGDLTATVANLRDNEGMFKLSMLAALLVQLVDIILVLMLYRLFVSVNQNVAKILVLLAVLGVPIALLNEVNHGAILLILDSPDISESFVLLFLGIHQYGIIIAGIFWGLWLFPMGYLVYKSNFMPKIIGIALMIGCFGYIADSFIYILLPDIGFQFAQFLFIGEVMMAFWLLIMGVNEEKWLSLQQV
ncbi:MAG: hypothetical protein COB56_00250 [Robiginitomaculum sp.]|nr:MAG: hypothetical protein COB56_00250 [Robiginitomaculum sp.]